MEFSTLLIWATVIIIIVVLRGYNKLRKYTEFIKESWSNIGVVAKKQASLINQLIETVRSYQDSEKLVMLKVSEDANLGSVQAMVQQSGMVLSTVNGMAQRFPELKSNEHYNRLISSIQELEGQLQNYRQHYNANVRQYNVLRTSIPHVFYSAALGFSKAPYLEFSGGEDCTDVGALRTIGSDDGERLNQLLGNAGSKVLSLGKTVGGQVLEAGKQLSSPALDNQGKTYHFLDREQNPQGPFSREQLLGLLDTGAINQDTLICASGDASWAALVSHFPCAGNALPQPPGLPSAPATSAVTDKSPASTDASA